MLPQPTTLGGGGAGARGRVPDPPPPVLPAPVPLHVSPDGGQPIARVRQVETPRTRVLPRALATVDARSAVRLREMVTGTPTATLAPAFDAEAHARRAAAAMGASRDREAAARRNAIAGADAWLRAVLRDGPVARDEIHTRAVRDGRQVSGFGKRPSTAHAAGWGSG